jgi:periplasmic protein CpxP/Spy
MKINKLLIITGLALGGLAASGIPAGAQEKPPAENQQPAPGRRGGPAIVERRLERLDQELTLTADQKPKVKAVLEQMQKKRQELMSDTSLTQEDRREKVRAIMKDENAKMKEILTPEQYTKFEKMRQERGSRSGRRNAGENKNEKKN